MRIEIHMLQNFAPSNLNRDDTGSPKDAEFGGYRRARVSSQCLKRAVRGYFKTEELLPAGHRAERTKRLANEVANRLTDKGRDEAAAHRAARVAVTAFLAGSEDGEEHKTPYLLFLAADEIEKFTAQVETHWDVFAAVPEPAAEGEAKAEEKPAGKAEGKAAKKTKKAKGDDGPKVPDGFAKAVEKLLDGGKAADLALFGRMLADLPKANVDAACQVAHALSTNKIHTTEMDYFTAVDDLKPDDTAGADMIGTVEFNSACYYRYANLDVGQLATNLKGDTELTRKTAGAFLRAFVHAVPTGKQNTFAAHNPPSLVFVTARNGGPVSLANAFVRPVAPKGDESLVAKSVEALDDYYGRVLKMYGDGKLVKSAVCWLDEVELKHLKDKADGVESVIESVVGAAFGNGGGA